MVHFIGAGPGDPELLTIKGKKLIDQADVIIYAGSLVNKEVLAGAKEGAEIYNSATMTLEEVIEVMKKAEAEGKMTARVHTGDPAVFGAHREQMDELSRLGIDYDVIPGVSSFLATAAALKKEYTLPGVSQTVILTRMEGRTPMPPKEKLRDLAKHNSTMIIFLSVGMIEQLADTLKEEYMRDLNKNLPIEIPKHYFENDDINATPLVTWRESANIVFGNWLNYCVYQDTPYNIDEIN